MNFIKIILNQNCFNFINLVKVYQTFKCLILGLKKGKKNKESNLENAVDMTLKKSLRKQLLFKVLITLKNLY